MPAILFYDAVVAVHVMAIVIAFGVIFTYPVVYPYLISNHPRALPGVHAAQDRVGKLVITPFGTLALVAGAYLASDRDLWGEPWVVVPLVVLIVIMGLGGAFFSPTERRLAEIARRDVEASASDAVTLSPEYEALTRRLQVVGGLASLLVLVAIFFMVAKPFA
jgi:uncharacterized membrane protein